MVIREEIGLTENFLLLILLMH